MELALHLCQILTLPCGGIVAWMGRCFEGRQYSTMGSSPGPCYLHNQEVPVGGKMQNPQSRARVANGDDCYGQYSLLYWSSVPPNSPGQPPGVQVVSGFGHWWQGLYLLDHPAGYVAPVSTVHSFFSLPRAALCFVWSIKWDHSPCCHGCWYFIFPFISTCA